MVLPQSEQVVRNGGGVALLSTGARSWDHGNPSDESGLVDVHPMPVVAEGVDDADFSLQHDLSLHPVVGHGSTGGQEDQ